MKTQKQGAIKYIRSLLQDFLQHYPTWYLHFYSLRSIFQAEMQLPSIWKCSLRLGALLLGGFYGGLGGAIGMTIGDLFDPKYVFYAPKTFVLKLCIGLITGLVAHHIGHINETKDSRKVLKFAIAAAVSGLLFNVIFDPLVGYYYKLWIMGKPAADLTLAWNVAATSINAVTSTIASVVIYMPVRTALIRSGLFEKLK